MVIVFGGIVCADGRANLSFTWRRSDQMTPFMPNWVNSRGGAGSTSPLSREFESFLGMLLGEIVFCDMPQRVFLIAFESKQIPFYKFSRDNSF